MPHTDPLVDVAIRKATKGHHDWLIWKSRDGDTQIGKTDADTYKAAMLATGTQKSFTLVAANSGHFYRVTWGLALRHLRNGRRYGFAS
jgi:hypothetical protein